MQFRLFWAMTLSVCLLPLPAYSDEATEDLLAAQRQAMAVFARFDGVWRGAATVLAANGKALQIQQVERVGPLLDGTLRLVQGSGYGTDGKRVFNAFAVLSYVPQTGKYNMRSHAHGRSGDFPVELQPTGYSWTLTSGPAQIRYNASVEDGVWTEVGERVVSGQAPIKIFEMRLHRIASTDWPGHAEPTQ